MTKLIKKVAAMAAAIMMMASMSIGASASGIIIDRDPPPYASKYMRMAVEGNIYTGTNKRSVYNLTTSRSSTKRYFYADAQILNSSLSRIDGRKKFGVLSLGNYLDPKLTLTNRKAYIGSFYSAVHKTTNKNSTIIDNKRIQMSLKY